MVRLNMRRGKGWLRSSLFIRRIKSVNRATSQLTKGPFASRFCSSTQSRAPFLNGTIPAQKCARKPKTIVVLLIANDQEYDRVSLDMAKDFKKIEPSTY